MNCTDGSSPLSDVAVDHVVLVPEPVDQFGHQDAVGPSAGEDRHRQGAAGESAAHEPVEETQTERADGLDHLLVLFTALLEGELHDDLGRSTGPEDRAR